MTLVVEALNPYTVIPAVRTLSENVLGQVDAVELMHLKNIQDSGLFDAGWTDDEILGALELGHEDRRALHDQQERNREAVREFARRFIAERLGGLPAVRVSHGDSERVFMLDVRVVDAVPVEQ